MRRSASITPPAENFGTFPAMERSGRRGSRGDPMRGRWGRRGNLPAGRSFLPLLLELLPQPLLIVEEPLQLVEHELAALVEQRVIGGLLRLLRVGGLRLFGPALEAVREQTEREYPFFGRQLLLLDARPEARIQLGEALFQKLEVLLELLVGQRLRQALA